MRIAVARAPRLLTVRAARKERTRVSVVRGWLERRVIVLGIIAVTLALVHVWLRLQVVTLGYELSAARQVQLKAEQERRELEVELSMLRNPGRIGEVARRRLGMVEPKKGQVTVVR